MVGVSRSFLHMDYSIKYDAILFDMYDIIQLFDVYDVILLFLICLEYYFYLL
jgi:hypothetical protein